MASKSLKKGAEIGGGVVVGGGILYGLYELYEYVKYRMFKSKNPTSTLTFEQYKKTPPA